MQFHTRYHKLWLWTAFKSLLCTKFSSFDALTLVSSVMEGAQLVKISCSNNPRSLQPNLVQL